MVSGEYDAGRDESCEISVRFSVRKACRNKQYKAWNHWVPNGTWAKRMAYVREILRSQRDPSHHVQTYCFLKEEFVAPGVALSDFHALQVCAFHLHCVGERRSY